MEKQTLRVTVASTVVAVAAAGAAFWSGYEAHKTRVEDERPVITAHPPSPQPPATPYMPIAINNVGKSTAKNVKVSFACNIGLDRDFTNTWNPEKLKPKDASYPYIYPGDWVILRCPEDTPYSLNIPVVELGIIQYQDLRNKNYQSPFCLEYQLLTEDRVDVSECPPGRNLPAPI